MNSSRALITVSRAALASRSTCIVPARNSSGYKPPAFWYPPTYNELPVPQGSWQAHYDAQNRKYNVHLAAGLGFFLFTVVFIKTSGIVEFNAKIPELPELQGK